MVKQEPPRSLPPVGMRGQGGGGDPDLDRPVGDGTVVGVVGQVGHDVEPALRGLDPSPPLQGLCDRVDDRALSG